MDAHTLTFWEAAVKSSPAIVALSIAVIITLLAFIRHLMQVLENRHAELIRLYQEMRREYADLHEKGMNAIIDNTAAMRELRAAIRDNGGR
ncbi:MAG: hypothetical protein N2483_03925 [Burkholderiaceae bacterium]|nr:hypothetical protein [Burkholderiaceae bacterium]